MTSSAVWSDGVVVGIVSPFTFRSPSHAFTIPLSNSSLNLSFKETTTRGALRPLREYDSILRYINYRVRPRHTQCVLPSRRLRVSLRQGHSARSEPGYWRSYQGRRGGSRHCHRHRTGRLL